MPENPKDQLQISDPAIANYLKKKVEGILEVNPKEVGLTSSTFGESKFDENAPIPTVLEGNLQDYRGKKQSRTDKVFNAIPRLVSKVGTEIAKTPAYIFALGEAGFTDKTLAESLDNAWLNNLDKFDKSVKDEFAIYKPKSVTEGNLWANLTSASFWTDEGVDGAVFLISMIAPGAALKAIGVAGKLAKLPGLSKIGVANIELGQATLLNTALESAAETKGIVDNLNQQFKVKIEQGELNPNTGRPWTQEEAKQAVGDAAVNTFQMNMGLLTIPNLIMNKNLLGRFGQSKGILDEFKDATGKFVTTNPVVKKSLLKEYAKNIGEASLSEGFLEEAGQTTIENYNQKVALNQTNKDILSGLAEEYINTLTTTEGQKSILLGAVLGSLGGVIGTKRQIKAEDKTRSSLSQLINDNFEGFNTSIEDIFEKDEKGIIIDPETKAPKINVEKASEVISNLVKEQQSSNLQDLEAIRGNKDMYDYIFNQQLSRFALPYLNQEGGIEVLGQHIDNLSNQLFQGKSDITETEHKQQVKSQIKDLQKVYDSLKETVNSLPLEELSKDQNVTGQFANKILGTAYAESSKQLFLTKQIDQINKDLLTVRAGTANDVSQFNLESEKLTKRLENLNKSLEISKENYKNIFDPKQQLEAFNNFSKQKQIIKDEIKNVEPQETEGKPFDITSQQGSYSENEELNNDLNNASTEEEVNTVFDKHYTDENAEELSKLKEDKLVILEEENKHLPELETLDSELDHITDNIEFDLNNEEVQTGLKSNLELINAFKNSSNYSKYTQKTKDKIESIISKFNKLIIIEEDVTNDLVNDTSNNQSDTDQNQHVENTTSPGIQDSVQGPKSFSTKVFNVVMMKLYEHTYKLGRFVFQKNPKNGEAIRTNSPISQVVNDSEIIKEDNIVRFELANLPDQTEQSIQIVDIDSNKIIGYVALPHEVVETGTEEEVAKRLLAREELIKQRAKILDKLNSGQEVLSKIYTKGPGTLLLKSTNEGGPIMGNIISRPQDLIDDRDIYIVDKGYINDTEIEGFVLPNIEDAFTKSADKKIVEEELKKFNGRTFSSKEGNGKGRVYKAVRNANGSWSLIPVYATNIGEKKSKSLVEKLKQYITIDPNTGDHIVDVASIYKEFGKDIYITNKEKHGVLKIDKFKINGKSWGALLNNKAFTEELTNHISSSKNNIVLEKLNVDNNIKDILQTNAYQDEQGQYFVQPYMEFEGIADEVVEETINLNNTIVTPAPIIQVEDSTIDDNVFNNLPSTEEDETGAFSRTKHNGKLDKSKVISFLEKNLPGLDLNDVEQASKVSPHVKDAVGMFYRSIIYLFKGATNKTAYHEAFHGVFRNMLSSNQRITLINEAKGLYNAPTIEDLQKLQETFKQIVSNTVLTQLYYEEKLADAFADYTDTFQSKSLTQKILDFFKDILKIFNIFNKYNENQINQLFKAVNTGKFKEKSKEIIYNRNIDNPLLEPAFKRPDTIPIAEYLDRVNAIENQFYSKVQDLMNIGIKSSDIKSGDLFNSIKEEYLSKAKSFASEGKKYEAAICQNVYTNFDSNYLKDVIKSLQKRKFNINVKENKETTEINLELQEGNTSKSYGQEMTSKSGISSVGDKIKFLLSSIPIRLNDNIKKDNLGFTEYYNYEKLYYQLEMALLGKETFEEQLDTIKDLAEYKPEMKAIFNILEPIYKSLPKQLSENPTEKEIFIKQFRSNFYKQQLKYKLVLFEKDRSTGKYTYKLIDSNRTSLKLNIKSEWENNLITPSRSSKNLTKFKDSENVLDFNKIVKFTEEIKDSEFTREQAYEFLYRVGIDFNKKDFNLLFDKSSKEIKNNLLWYVKFLELKANDIKNDDSTKQTYKKGREGLEFFVDKQILFNQNLFTESFNNVENSSVFTIQHNSFASKFLDKLTKGNVSKSINDLKRDPIYQYLNLLSSPEITKKIEVYAVDGLKDGVGENEGKKYRSIHDDDFIAASLVNYINASGNQSIQGTDTAIYAPIVPSDKSQAFFVRGPKYSNFIVQNDKIIESDSVHKFYNIFMLEVERIKEAFKTKDLYNKETKLIEEGKLKKRTFLPIRNYHYGAKSSSSAFDGNAFKFNLLAYSDNLSVKGELYNKIFDAILKTDLSAKEFFETTGSNFKPAYTSEILQVLNNNYSELMDRLKKSGIIKLNKDNELTSNVIDLSDYRNLSEESEDVKIKKLIAEFTSNSLLFNSEYSLLMNSDPAYYKNGAEWAKRFYQSQAATQSFDSNDFKDGKLDIIAIKDVELPINTESYNDIIDMTKSLPNGEETKEILDKGYKKVNVADAQFYVSLDMYKKMLISLGKYTPELAKAIEIAKGSIQGLNSKDYHQQLSILKTFTYINEFNSKTGKYEPKQVKCAILPLTQSLVKDNPLLKDYLDQMEANPEGPQSIAMESTFKALQPEYNDISKGESSNVISIDVSGMGLQTDNPNHGLDHDNSSTRQLKMILPGGLNNTTKYGPEELIGQQIKKELSKLEATNYNEALKELVEQFNNKDEKLLAKIQKAITKRNATSIIEKIFEIDLNTGKFAYPLDTLPTRQTIELLSSIFTKEVILQEFNGGSMVQASGLGFQFKSKFKTLKEQQEQLVEKSEELSKIQTNLKWIRKEDNKTIKHIEVALPYYFSEFVDNNGNLKKDIPEELLQIIGYRIPTEGPHSILPLKVVSFLPKEYGNVILLPYEITTQMGADFDFDKIYFLAKDFYTIGDTLNTYKYTIETKDVDIRYNQYVASVLANNKEALDIKREFRSEMKVANKAAIAEGKDITKVTFKDDIQLLTDEGFIISKEDFSKLSTEEQLTKEARNNRILQLYDYILRDINTLHSLISPSGPGEISDVYEQVEQYKSEAKPDFFSFLGQLKIKKLFDDIIGLKGQSALKVTGHSYISFGNLETKNTGFKFREKGNLNIQTMNNLSQSESRTGGKIVEELSSMMAAILDAVKTPTLLPYLNISNKTIDVWATIVRYGMGTKVASQFTSQEAVGLISDRLMENDKQIKDDVEFNNNIIDDVYKNYESKFKAIYDKYTSEEISPKFFGSVITDKEKLKTILSQDILVLESLNDFAGQSEEIAIKKINSETKNKEERDYKLLRFYLTQMNVVSSFKSMSVVAKKLQQVDTIFGLNKEVGPTFETVNGKNLLVDEVLTYEYNKETNTGIFEGVTNLLQEDVIKSLINTNREFLKVLDQYFGFANEYYNNIKNTVATSININNTRKQLNLKPEDRDKINSFVFSYLDASTTMGSIYKQSPEEAGFTDSEFVDEVRMLKSEKFDSEYKWKIFGNRSLKEETKNRLTNTSLIQFLITSTIKNSDIKQISLKAGKLELVQKEKIISDILTLYNDKNTKGLILGLIQHSFKATGLYTGLNSYHSLIDPSILEEIGFISNRGFIKNELKSDENEYKNTIFVDRLINQFVRNNPKMTKVFRLDAEKGATLFTKSVNEGKDIYTPNLDTTHSRKNQLFSESKTFTEYIRIMISDSLTGFKGAKMFKYNKELQGYTEISKLGVPGKLVEVNPFFDLDRSTYTLNNYVKETKGEEFNIPTVNQEETLIQTEDKLELSVENPSPIIEEILDNQIIESYNKQKQISDKFNTNSLPDDTKPCE